MRNPDATDLDTVSAEEREILAYLLERERQSGLRSQRVKPRPAGSDAPLSFAQQRLWILDQMADIGAAYNWSVAMQICGPLRADLLEKCLTEILRRHEVLRSTIEAGAEEPLQRAHPAMPANIEIVDLTGVPADRIDDEVRDRIRQTAAARFDLSRGPLLRSKLLRLQDQRHVLVLCMHHVVSDGWSLGVLMKELSTLYQAYLDGRASPLPELPVQYADYALWQRNWLAGGELGRQLDYWREKLQDLSTLELPTDRTRPAVPTFSGGHETLTIDDELRQALANLSKKQGCTLFVLLQAAFVVLLHRYSGQDDIVLGSPVANRNRIELEGLIGFFVNMLVMRTDVSGNPGFGELLERVRDTAFGAFEHQDLPFERLVDELHAARDTSRNPLFQVSFALEEKLEAAKEMAPGLTLSPMPAASPAVRFDLELFVTERPRDMQLLAVYNTDLFDAPTIENLLCHLRELLRQIVADPACRVGDFDLLTEAERRLQIVDWNRTAVAYPRDKTVCRLVEEQAEANPQALAIDDAGRQVSYAQLNAAANRLAHFLIENGVGTDVPVLVLMRRSAELVIAQLAVLKAGGAYVPTDPDYPPGRLSFMLDDSRARVLLTQSSLLDKAGAFGGRSLCLDQELEELNHHSEDNPRVPTRPGDLAYVVYTSGSTGEPKGVEIPHSGLVNLVSWHCRTYQVEASDRATHLAGLGFDASVWESWPYLCAGASIHLVPDERRLAPDRIWSWLSEQGITLSFLPTPLAESALRESLPQRLALRALLTGGDRLHGGLVQRQLPFSVVNHYGPSENSVVATFAAVDLTQAGDPPIGRPIDNVETYILDRYLQPVPVGVPGELFIGGAGLARGYLNRAELTAEKFIENPFDKDSRLYRTGDKASYRRDGAIDFHGRFDHQVKLRGFRIELGEIENTLINHPALRDAVAILRKDRSGDKYIAAYVVPSAEWVAQVSRNHSGEHVGEWQALYDETYGKTDDEQDLERNFTGWNSSYTGEPIALEEMREWQESTLSRIAAFGPERVLEIGCGSGLLLLRLAPECARYVGTDFSAVVLGQLQSVVSAREDCDKVELSRRMADDFEGFRAGEFDTVIVNSVVQYFPNIDYLVGVIEGAVAATADGGRIFLGDIRSLPLLKVFHASLQLDRSADEIDAGDFLRYVEQQVESDQELVIEPAFFHALRQRIPRLSQVEVLLKRGRHINETSAYRYDVVLHVETQAEPLPANGQWLEWGEAGLDETELRQRLAAGGQQDWLGVRAIPNARVAGDVEVLELIEEMDGLVAVEELTRRVESALPVAIEPERLWRIAGDAGWYLELSYSGAGTDGRMDALFRRRRREDCAGAVFWPQQQAPSQLPWSAYGNNPLKARLAKDLIPLLRGDLQQQVPAYMLPAVFVLLEALPLTANGKVDRRALPPPGELREGLGDEYTAPRNELEQQLARIFGDVLKIDRVGVDDNFFELGGHSLMATQVASRIRATLGVELPLSELFSRPTVAQTALVVDELAGDTGDAASQAIARADRSHPLPLSYPQQRLWYLEQLEPGSSAYVIPGAIKLTGALDIEALRRSLREIVDRHEVLRSIFTLEGGQPVQNPVEEFAFELALEDLSAADEAQRSARLAQRMNDEAMIPFDIASGPMIRFRLLRLSADEHVLLFAMHHIASDGWSIGILYRELGTLYTAFSQGRSSPLPELPLQYADFAAWQRDRLAGERLRQLLDYWRQRLEGIGTLQLPTDRPRPPVQTFDGAYRTLLLDSDTSRQLQALNGRYGVTPFMTLVGAFAVLLQRYSRQDDIVIGTPIANRQQREVEDLIGFFVNSLVIRTDVSGNPRFEDLLQRVKQDALDAFKHQDLPFEMLVDELQPERDRSRNPLFQVSLAVQNAPSHSLALEGLTLEGMAFEKESVRFDLELHIWQGGDNLKFDIAYNTDLFDAATIERMLGHYRTILRQIAADPGRRVDDLELLTARERERQVIEWNQTSTAYPSDKTVHELFQIQVAETPRAIALEYEDLSLSYEELNQRANQLAHYLQARGVAPETRVGLMLQRGPDLAVATLGILKAGGAYVPLDPDYPRARLEFMAEDAGIPILVSNADLADRLDFGGEKVLLDTDCERMRREATGDPESGASPGSLAYVIYTSGSTGRPKGTLIEHRSVVRLVRQTNYVDLGADEVMLQFAPISFDASTFELWGSLLNGGRLAVFPAGLSSLEELGRFIESRRVTTLWLTASLFNQMVDKNLSRLSAVRQILAGGEALSQAHVLKLLRELPGCRLINGYGPTENTTFTCCHVMTGPADAEAGVPIGRPISNTTVYVVDQNMHLVPPGVPGELLIGGDGLARGYLNRPELTAEKFIANPFTDQPGARLYRTGDEVAYRSDGAIDFLGRFDDQVKLRGFRIELGEIEAALNQLDGIDRSVAVLREDEPGDKRLVAYLVSGESPAPETPQLRAMLRQSLPEYMLPSSFVYLEALPLNANGKVDRKALPRPTTQKTAVLESDKPGSEMEVLLAEIWGELLEIDDIEKDDMFFDLGGHSLLTIEVIDRFYQETGIKIPVASFMTQTLRQIAAFAETAPTASGDDAG